MSEQSTNGTEQCHRCEERPADVFPKSSDPPLCCQCVSEIKRGSAREGECGQGQRHIAEQHAIGRSLQTGVDHPTKGADDE